MTNSFLSSLQTSLSKDQLQPTFSILTIHEGNANSDDPLFCSVASIADQEKTKQEQLLLHTGGVTGLWGKLSKSLTLSKKGNSYTLRVLEEKKIPFYELLQRGLQRAQGKLIGFLQPDEQYLPDALANVEKVFEDHPDCDVVISSHFVDSEKNLQEAVPFSLEYLTTSQPVIPLATLFCHASLIKDDFHFDPSYDSLAVTEWLIRIIKARKKVHYLSQPTCVIPLAKNQPISSEAQQKILHHASAVTRLLRPWWKICYQLAVKKNKPTQAASCLVYQLDSLAERKPL